MIIYMYRPGPCIRLTKTVSKTESGDLYPDIDKTFIIPMDQDFSISATQTLKEPVKELFQYIQEAVIGASGDLFGSTGSTLARAGLEIANLTGFQLGTKGYYAKAWGGSQPSTLSITAKFYRGMQGKWDSSQEVLGGARRLMALTLPFEPNGGGVTLNAPVPSPLTVFTTYATQVITDAIKSITTARDTGQAAGTVAIDTLSGSGSQQLSNAVKTEGTNLKSSAVQQFISTDTWGVDFGYFDGKTITPFLMLQRYVVESSTIKMGSQLEKNPDGFYYPTTAEVMMSMVSQDILTSANFQSAAGQAGYNRANHPGTPGST